MNNPLGNVDPLGLCPNVQLPGHCVEVQEKWLSIMASSGGLGEGWAYGPWAGEGDSSMGAGSAGALDQCGVDPFCVANGGVSPFDLPEAQVHCIDGYCMVGSANFAQYNIGGTYTVNWDAQKQAEIQWGVEAFLKQEAAVAARLGTSVENLRQVYLNSDGSLKDPNNEDTNPFLQGGNWNFQIGESKSERAGSIPSLHFHDTGFVHLDTANPSWGFGLGAVIHLGVDVLMGNTILGSGIPRW